MKALNSKSWVLVAALIAALIGCAQQKRELPPPNGGWGGPGFPTPYPCVGNVACASPTPTCDEAPEDPTYGATVQLTSVSRSVLDKLSNGGTLNNPGVVKLHVDLTPYTVKIDNVNYTTFGGDLKIRFTDDLGESACRHYDHDFSAGYGQKAWRKDGYDWDTKYNQWNAPTTNVLTGDRAIGKLRVFSEHKRSDMPGSPPEKYPYYPSPGSLIFIAEADGDAGKVKGSVWYYKFPAPPGGATHAPTWCWFIYDGPYMCREFGVTPAALFQKLGIFTNLDRASALNE